MGDLEIFLEPFSKCSCLFTSVLFITLKPGTFVFLHHSFCMMVSLSLGTPRSILIILHPIEGTCIHFLLHLVLDTLTKPFCVWCYHVGVFLHWKYRLVLDGVIGRIILGVVFDFQLVEWLGGILASL